MLGPPIEQYRMIKLGCNAMLRVAEDLPYADKEDPRNWLDIAALVRQIRAWDLDVVDFQLFRGFRGRDPAYLRSIKALCQQCGLPIGFLGVGRGFVGVEQIAPHATYVRAKIYKIDRGREEWLDYERIVEILRQVDFNGNMSIVFEGRGNAVSDLEAIGLAVDYLRGLLA